MQKILIALGDTVTSGAIQDILKALAVPAILDGYNLTAPESDQISVSPGVALTDSGVLIYEDEIRVIQFTPTVQPGNYTLYYRYVPSQNFGGNPASLEIENGLIPETLFTNGVLLGWLKYPGGSVPLANSMFVSAKRIKIDSPPITQDGVYLNQYAPFSYDLTRTFNSGPFLSISEAYDGTLKAPITNIQNTGGSTNNSKFIYPFQISPEGLGKIRLEFAITSAASVTITLIKSDGTVVNPLETNFFINQTMDDVQLSFDQSNNFVPNDVAYVQFDLAINPGNVFTLKAIGHSAFTEPF